MYEIIEIPLLQLTNIWPCFSRRSAKSPPCIVVATCQEGRGGRGPCLDWTVKSRKEKISPDFTDGKQWLAAQHRRPVHSLHKQCVSRYIVCSTILYIVILYYIVHCTFYNIETKVYCRKEGCVGLRKDEKPNNRSLSRLVKSVGDKIHDQLSWRVANWQFLILIKTERRNHYPPGLQEA